MTNPDRFCPKKSLTSCGHFAKIFQHFLERIYKSQTAEVILTITKENREFLLDSQAPSVKKIV